MANTAAMTPSVTPSPSHIQRQYLSNTYHRSELHTISVSILIRYGSAKSRYWNESTSYHTAGSQASRGTHGLKDFLYIPR